MGKKDYYKEVIQKGIGLSYGIDQEEIKKAQEYNFFKYLKENYSSVFLEGVKDIWEEGRSSKSNIHDALPLWERISENLEVMLYRTIAIPVYSIVYLMPAEIVNNIKTLVKYPKKKKAEKELLRNLEDIL